jgi:hypothetical protein
MHTKENAVSRADEEVSRVPSAWGLADVYRHLYRWHKKHGLKTLESNFGSDRNYVEAYRRMLNDLPAPGKAKTEDMIFISAFYGHGIFEWSYPIEDEDGILLGSYYLYAQNICYEQYGDSCHDLSRTSSLSEITNDHLMQVIEEVAESLARKKAAD